MHLDDDQRGVHAGQRPRVDDSDAHVPRSGAGIGVGAGCSNLRLPQGELFSRMPQQMHLHIEVSMVRLIEWRSPILAGECSLIGDWSPI
jgi:hypothetical protein